MSEFTKIIPTNGSKLIYTCSKFLIVQYPHEITGKLTTTRARYIPSIKCWINDENEEVVDVKGWYDPN